MADQDGSALEIYIFDFGGERITLPEPLLDLLAEDASDAELRELDLGPWDVRVLKEPRASRIRDE